MTVGKDLVSAFADTLERRDWPAFEQLLDPHVIYEIPQTRERVRGPRPLRDLQQGLPG